MSAVVVAADPMPARWESSRFLGSGGNDGREELEPVAGSAVVALTDGGPLSKLDSNISQAGVRNGINFRIRLRICKWVHFLPPTDPTNAVTYPTDIKSDFRSSILRSPNHAQIDRATDAANSAGAEKACGGVAGTIVVMVPRTIPSAHLHSVSVVCAHQS